MLVLPGCHSCSRTITDHVDITLGLLVLRVLQADLSSSTVDLVEEVGLLSVLRESEFEELKHDGWFFHRLRPFYTIRLVKEGTESP